MGCHFNDKTQSFKRSVGCGNGTELVAFFKLGVGQLGNLGYFSAKLKARPVMDAKEIHAQSIYFDNVNFRPSSSFRKKVRGFVEKAKSGFAHSAEVPVEERRRRLEKFLDERPMIRRKEYTQLTGLLKNKALNELNGWVKEGVLDTIGSGSHKIYVRVNTMKD